MVNKRQVIPENPCNTLAESTTVSRFKQTSRWVVRVHIAGPLLCPNQGQWFRVPPSKVALEWEVNSNSGAPWQIAKHTIFQIRVNKDIRVCPSSGGSPDCVALARARREATRPGWKRTPISTIHLGHLHLRDGSIFRAA